MPLGLPSFFEFWAKAQMRVNNDGNFSQQQYKLWSGSHSLDWGWLNRREKISVVMKMSLRFIVLNFIVAFATWVLVETLCVKLRAAEIF
jgi:hypothetical protein